MSKPEAIPQEVWDSAAQKASDYLWWVFECWPNTKLPAERLVERLTYDYASAILAAKAEEQEACAAIPDLVANHKFSPNDERDLQGTLRALAREVGQKTASQIAIAIRKRGAI